MFANNYFVFNFHMISWSQYKSTMSLTLKPIIRSTKQSSSIENINKSIPTLRMKKRKKIKVKCVFAGGKICTVNIKKKLSSVNIIVP